MQIPLREKRFAHSRLRVNRAISIWSEFAKVFNAYIADQPFETKCDDPDGSGIGIYTISRYIPIPEEMAPLIGDLVHNLRVALDYIAVELARENNITDPALLKRTYFPISPDEKSFKMDGKSKIKSCTQQAQDVIYNLQPFHDGMKDLYTLHQLDLVDKHNSIVPVGAASLNFGAQFSIPMDPTKTYNGPVMIGGSYNVAPRKFPIKVGDEIGRILSKTGDAKTATGRAEFQIVFHDVGGADGYQVPQYLEHLIQLINWVIDHIDQAVDFNQ